MNAIKTPAVGIYKIENTLNGHLYIGQSINLNRREKLHFYGLKNNIHKNRHLQNSFNKYGISNFKFKVILICEKHELTRYEQKLVNKLNPHYNICKDCVVSHAGVKRSLKTKEKLSTCHKKENLSQETLRKMSLAKVGKKAWNKGLICPQFSGRNNPMFGKHLSIEIKGKISNAKKGKKTKKRSIQARINMGKSRSGEKHYNFGKHLSLEHRRKLSESCKGKNSGEKHYLFGKNIPIETRLKMSESHKKRAICAGN